jgi:O-antigen/teichoic acid export membrane protein
MLAGNLSYAACQWGMLIILAKVGSAAMVGQFGLALALTAPVFMFTNLNLRSVQATDARHLYGFSDYLGLRLISVAIALLVIVGIASLGYQASSAAVIIAMGIAKAVEATSDVFYGLLQQYERMDRLATSMIVKGLASLAGLGLCVYLTGSVLIGVMAIAASWALVLFGYDLPKSREVLQRQRQIATPGARDGSSTIGPRWQARTLFDITKLSLPLGIVMMLVSLNTNVPRYFIEYFHGKSDLGIFTALSYMIVAGSTVINAIGQSVVPRLAKYYAAGRRQDFSALMFRLVGFGLLLGLTAIVAVALIGRDLLALLYQAEYARGDVFLWLTIAGALSYIASFFGYGLTAARYFRIQTPLFLLVTLSTGLACLWFVPAWGLLGAALALVCAAVVQVVAGGAALLHALRALK